MNIRIGKFTAVEPSGTWTGGPPYYEPTILDWQLLDQMGAQAVDGDHGGCWAPLTTIIINGNLDVTGPTLVLGQGTMTSNIAGAWELQGSPVPQFPQLSDTHIGRSRVIVTSCSSGRAALPYGAVPFLFGLQAVAQNFVNLDANGNLSSVDRNTLFVPIRVHNGATLSSVAVSFALTQDHIVTNPPAFRVVRVDNFGGQVPLTSVAAGAVNVSGYVQPTGITYNNGFAQTATVTCDQNNVIDITNYSYVLEIIEEQGQVGYPYVLAVTQPVSCATVTPASLSVTSVTSAAGLIQIKVANGARWLATGVLVNVTGITGGAGNGLWLITMVDSTDFTLNSSTFSGSPVGGTVSVPQQLLATTANTIDGVIASSGVVLVKDVLNQADNGMWSVQFGQWTRSQTPIFQGMIVPVAAGAFNAGTYWQLQTPPTYTLSTFPDWPFNSVVNVGQIIAPSGVPSGAGGPLTFQCTTGGITGVTQPTWPTAQGATAIDGEITQGPVVSNGTSPPAVTLVGLPLAIYQPLEIAIDGAGNLAAATFRWFINGALQASAIPTAPGSVALGSTGITAVFPSGTYSLNNTYTSYATGTVIWTTVYGAVTELAFEQGPTGGASAIVPQPGFVAQGTLYLQAAATFIDIVDTRFQ